VKSKDLIEPTDTINNYPHINYFATLVPRQRSPFICRARIGKNAQWRRSQGTKKKKSCIQLQQGEKLKVKKKKKSAKCN